MADPPARRIASAGEAEDRDIVGRIEGRIERVHINLGPDCNNNCIFCMEEDRDARRKANASLTPERIRLILEANAGAEEVCFTSGEPTLVPRLPVFVSWARRNRFRRISLMTNGRRLAHRAYAAKLAKAGLNFFYISLHGHTRKLHDGLVRTPGAYEQTVAGIKNIAELKRYYPDIMLHTSTVVTKRNVGHFTDVYRFLRDLGVDQVVFNVMQANGRANTHFERLFPTYPEIATRFAEFVAGEPEERPMAFLVDIPLCATEAVPDFNRGYVESYVHYEVEGEGMSDLASKPAEGMDGSCPELHEVARDALDDQERQKRAECYTCRYEPHCEGVWRNYLARYGWEGLEPVPRRPRGEP